MFNKLKINLKNGKLRQLEVLNMPFLRYGKFNNKNFSLIFNKKFQRDEKQKPVFYLKINRNIEDSLLCLQYWINLVDKYGSDFYILCDSENLRKSVLKNLTFYTPEIKFIKSYKTEFKKINCFQEIAPNWINASCAHLSVFLHAKKNNIKKYWNIDADDTAFLTEPHSGAKFLEEAQKYAEINNIDLFSFDFWTTKTKNKHWSFGITYTNTTKDILSLLETNKINWNNYRNWTSVRNIDWVFTFLKDTKKLNSKTFYVENLYFIHFGRFFSDLKNANIAYWNKGKMYWPIWSDIFKDKRGVMNIPLTDDIIKFDLQFTQEDCLNYAIKYFVNWDRLPID